MLNLQDIAQSWTLDENPNLQRNSTRSQFWFTANCTERYPPNQLRTFDWSHTQSQIGSDLIEDDELVLNKSLIQNLSQILIKCVFQMDSHCLQQKLILLFIEKIELSKFRQNRTDLYRYIWRFVSIQTLWPAFKCEILTYVSIQTRVCIDTYISFLKSWLICIEACKHDSIHHALSGFLRDIGVYRYMQAWFDTQVTLCLWETTFVSIQVIYVSIQIAQNQSEVISGHLYRYTCLCIDT
jgi:hypothetical protein